MDAPAFSCPAPPACAREGAVVQLDGACATASDITLAYVVGGDEATNATCPSVDAPLAVMVRLRSFSSQLNCTWAPLEGFQLTSESRLAILRP